MTVEVNVFEAMDTLRKYSDGGYVPLAENMTAAAKVVSLMDQIFRDATKEEISAGVTDYILKLRIRVTREDTVQ